MTEERLVVSVVGRPTANARRTRVVAALEARGATVLPATTEAALGTIVNGADAIVLDVGAEPSAFAELASAIRADRAAATLPCALIVDERVLAADVSPLGGGLLLAADDHVEAGVADLVERAWARRREMSRAAELEGQLVAMTRRLKKLREHGSTLAHDARVLFGVVIGFGCNLRDGIAGPVDETQTKHLASIVAAANDASALVDRHAAALAAISLEAERDERLASLESRADPRRRLNDVGELVRATASMFEGIAAGKGIALHVETEPVLAWCDAVLVKQAVVNLLTNALKFTEPGGSVEVAALRRAPASGNGQPSRAEVEIFVVDTGPGIPPAERKRVFERGVRLERDAETPGSGLGLAVVRDVARLHGGSVRIDDGARGGASFVLALPVDLRARGDEPPPSSARGLS